MQSNNAALCIISTLVSQVTTYSEVGIITWYINGINIFSVWNM